jgi:hypothetical protein
MCGDSVVVVVIVVSAPVLSKCFFILSDTVKQQHCTAMVLLFHLCSLWLVKPTAATQKALPHYRWRTPHVKTKSQTCGTKRILGALFNGVRIVRTSTFNIRTLTRFEFSACCPGYSAAGSTCLHKVRSRQLLVRF